MKKTKRVEKDKQKKTRRNVAIIAKAATTASTHTYPAWCANATLKNASQEDANLHTNS